MPTSASHPMSSPPQLPKDSIQRGYEAVLDRCARLLSFATSLPVSSDTNIPGRQIALAIDDLIILAIHSRRLIADVGVSKLALQARVQTLEIRTKGDVFEFYEDGSSIAISKLFNLIIHNESIELVRDSLPIFAQVKRRTLMELIDHQKVVFHPVLFVKSSESRLFRVSLSKFILLFATDVLEPLVDRCAEAKIFLEHSLFDS